MYTFSYSAHFREVHIEGINGEHKNRNHVAAFDKTKYRSVVPLEQEEGEKVWAVTIDPIEFNENGKQNEA